MSTLNVSVIALVAVVVAMVMVFNFWQSRVNRRAAERLFRQQNGIIEERAGIARRRQESFERGMAPELGLDSGAEDPLFADDPHEPRIDPDAGPSWSPAPAKLSAAPVPTPTPVPPVRHDPAPSTTVRGSTAQAEPVARPPALDRFADDLRRITDRMPRVVPDAAVPAAPFAPDAPRAAAASEASDATAGQHAGQHTARHAQTASDRQAMSGRPVVARGAIPEDADREPSFTLVDTPGGMTVDGRADQPDASPAARPTESAPDRSAPGRRAGPGSPPDLAPRVDERVRPEAEPSARTVAAATPAVADATRGIRHEPARATSVDPSPDPTHVAAIEAMHEQEGGDGARRDMRSGSCDAFLHAMLLPPSPVNTDRLIALMSSLRHVGSKPVRIEIDGGDGRFAPLVAGGLASRIRCAALLANRQGPLNAVELSDFVAALAGFAEQLGARFEQPDMGEVLTRARRLDSLAADLDTQVELTVEAPGPVGASQLVTIGKSLGLYERGGGRFACLSEDGRALYTMSAAPGADQIVFVLDVPRVLREAEPWPAMVRCAGDCARLVGGRLVDSQARGLSVGMIEAVGRQLDERFEQLEAAGLKAGSDVSLLVFN